MDKVKEYYDKMATSDAYTFVMGACSFFLILCHSPNFVNSSILTQR